MTVLFVIILFFQNCGSGLAPLTYDLQAHVSSEEGVAEDNLPGDFDADLGSQENSNDQPLPPGGDKSPTEYPLNPVPENATIEVISSGHSFTEGPSYHRPSNTLYFSDFSADAVFRVDLSSGDKEQWKTQSNRSNGGMFDGMGRFYSLEGRQSRKVVRHNDIDNVANTVTIAEDFEGKRLHMPNDLDLHADGSLYFTDPNFNNLTNGNRVSFRGVYKVTPNGDVVNIINSGLDQPNGIAISPSQNALYVTDSPRGELIKYKLSIDGMPSEPQTIFKLTNVELKEGTLDGMTVDIAGNIYLSAGSSALVLSSKGDFISRLEIGERVTNLTFGGTDNKTLFITCFSTVRSVKLLIPGKPKPFKGP